MTTDVFISYCQTDEDTAVAKRLETNLKGYEVWRDVQTPNGTLWRPLIDIKLKEASLVVVIISTKSMQSAYVTYEWCYAWLHLNKHLHKELYWICLEEPTRMGGMFSRLLDLQLPLKSCLKDSQTEENDWNKIVSDIKERLKEFAEIVRAGESLLVSGSERERLRSGSQLRQQQVDAVNKLGEAVSHKSKARDYLHKSIRRLLSGDPDGVVIENIARALSKVGDLSSVPYLWLAYNSQQVLEYAPARQALSDVLTHLSSCLYDFE